MNARELRHSLTPQNINTYDLTLALSYYPGIRLEVLRITAKNLSQNS